MTADHTLPVRNMTAATEVCLNEGGEQQRSTTITMCLETAGRERKTVVRRLGGRVGCASWSKRPIDG